MFYYLFYLGIITIKKLVLNYLINDVFLNIFKEFHCRILAEKLERPVF